MSEQANDRGDNSSITEKPHLAPSGTTLPTLQNRLRRPVRTRPPEEAATADTAAVYAPVSVHPAALVPDGTSTPEAVTTDTVAADTVAAKTAETTATETTGAAPESTVRAEPVQPAPAPAPRPRKTRPVRQGRQPEPAPPAAPGKPKPDDVEQIPHVGPQRVVVYLRAEVAEAVRGARRTGVTNADVIFDAIEQTGIEELKRLVAAQTRGGRQVPTQPGRIFSRQVGSVALNKVRFEARLLGSDCELIDQAVEQAGADNRSELIEIALYKHLLSAQR